jgi:hypothetical protein
VSQPHFQCRCALCKAIIVDYEEKTVRCRPSPPCFLGHTLTRLPPRHFLCLVRTTETEALFRCGAIDHQGCGADQMPPPPKKKTVGATIGTNTMLLVLLGMQKLLVSCWSPYILSETGSHAQESHSCDWCAASSCASCELRRCCRQMPAPRSPASAAAGASTCSCCPSAVAAGCRCTTAPRAERAATTERPQRRAAVRRPRIECKCPIQLAN